MIKFKNKTKNDFTIPGIGLVKGGEVREMPEGFHNANFEKVEQDEVVKPEKKEDNKGK